MTVALGHGLLDLRLAPAGDGTTRIVHRQQRYPLHVTAALHADAAQPGMAFVYIQNPSGGIFGDDVLDIDVVAEPGARVHLTTTSATKAYAMPDGVARQRMRVVVRAGAYVEYVPQLLIPQQGSSLDQSLEIVLEPGAACVAVEGVAPGRLARGEAFAYDRLALTTSVRSADGDELAVDAIVLEPGRRAPAARGLLGRFPYFGTAVVAQLDGADGLADTLDATLRDQVGVAAGAGALPNGCGTVARVLAESSPALRRTLDATWAAARLAFLDGPLPRRPQ
jgi:urease accessory protein